MPVEINARYLDALTLLLSEQGKLVSKDRFLDEVWGGVPVTDEALFPGRVVGAMMLVAGKSTEARSS